MGHAHYFFPILHLNITNVPLHAGTWGGFSLLQDGEERWGSHCLPAHSFMGYPKYRRGWFGQCMAWRYFAQSKADISVHTPTTHPEKKTTWSYSYGNSYKTALNFNSQPSPTQSPLIATRPMNVRCLEWKQRVKIPVWIFSWKSVIENHLSVRQNQLLHVKLKKSNINLNIT